MTAPADGARSGSSTPGVPVPGGSSDLVVVDDEVAVLDGLRWAARRAFGAQGATFFSDAVAAREALLREPPAVLVTDWLMPGLDGVALCRSLREAERARGSGYTYVILFTGRGGVEDAVAALEAGVDDFVRKPLDARELVARIAVGRRFVELTRRLEREAVTDVLTGLPNRREGERVLAREALRVGRGKQHLGVALLDVDHFKRVNDTLGHPAGDEVLKAVASTVRATCRAYDHVARWGGEEILIVYPHGSLPETVVAAERCRAAVAAIAAELPAGGSVAVTASIGVAWARAGLRASPEELADAADRALYQAKGDGRDRVVAVEVAAGWSDGEEEKRR